jgi:WD40 repeat protein
VRFSTVPAANQFAAEMLVQSLTSTSYTTFVAATTDAAGRAAVLVMYGTTAGAGRIVVSVPTLALQDTARFTILPGAASRVTILPADTTVYAGRSYTLRGGVVDRFGNVRTDPVTYTTTTPGITVSSTGVVTAPTIGRYTLEASAAGLTGKGTGSVSVVPQGTLTATRGTSTGLQIIRVDLDGSNYRELTTVSDGGIGPSPKWIPGTNSIVYTHYDGSLQVLQTVDENRAVSRFIKNAPSTMSHQAIPSPARGAPVIYFGAHDTRCTGNGYCIHRAAIDGSNPELLGTLPQGLPTERLSSSPDGSKVAFSNGQVRVFDYASKTVAPWAVTGEAPSWSSDGTTIAYVTSSASPIRLVNADGTNARLLSLPGREYGIRSMSWSSDSRWLLAQSTSGVLDLIDVATGKALPLGFTAGYSAGSLK